MMDAREFMTQFSFTEEDRRYVAQTAKETGLSEIRVAWTLHSAKRHTVQQAVSHH